MPVKCLHQYYRARYSRTIFVQGIRFDTSWTKILDDIRATGTLFLSPERVSRMLGAITHTAGTQRSQSSRLGSGGDTCQSLGMTDDYDDPVTVDEVGVLALAKMVGGFVVDAISESDDLRATDEDRSSSATLRVLPQGPPPSFLLYSEAS
ncbi:hypothetical protein GYMLUDRAFT_238865 [Collybiopsis luxurians FD-317 M1]|nr:hypothetical protein GYMLUDRAFT_238865 [Collybiopsis luxurians FD-317 M1]